MHNTPIRQIICSDYNTLILKENNDVLIFGVNLCNQLGLGLNIESQNEL